MGKNSNPDIVFMACLDNPIRSEELLEILECEEVAANWFADYDYTKLLLCMHRFLLKLHNALLYNKTDNSKIINLDIERKLSERQLYCAKDILMCIDNYDFGGAYHELHDCIEDRFLGRNKDRFISIYEFDLFEKVASKIINVFDKNRIVNI